MENNYYFKEDFVLNPKEEKEVDEKNREKDENEESNEKESSKKKDEFFHPELYLG